MILKLFHVCLPKFVRKSLSFLLVKLVRMSGSPDAHEIVPGIWLGNRVASLNDKWLKQNNITVVFNATKDLPFSTSIKKQYRIPVDDNLEKDEIRNMTLWSHEAVYKVLHEQNNGHKILIHCFAGMQRSAAIVAMYLIATTGMSWQQSMNYIKNIRPIVFTPSANFKNSIIEFDRSYHQEIIPHLS